MAISIIDHPIDASTPTVTPYRPTYVDCSSSQANIVRLIADVFINGSGTISATIEKEPNLGFTDEFRIELGEINKKYLTSEFFETSLFLETHECILSANTISMLIYEVYDLAGVLTTTWDEDGTGTGGASSGLIYQFNGVNQHLQDLTERYCNGVTKKLLTNRPQNSKIINNQIYKVGCLPLTEGFSSLIRCAEYDGLNGTGSLVTTNDSAAVGVVSFRKASYTIDPSQLNTATKSIKYSIHDGAGVQVSEFTTVNVVSGCGDEVTIYWQNHWGEFDQYFFSGNQIQTTKNSVKSISQRLNLDYASTDRGERDIRRDNSREFEVFTRTERPEVVEWLAEIGESVDAFVMIGTDRVPINIKRVSSEIVNDEDLVTQISVKYTMANERISQLG